jgi:cell shape-determining protein MreC
LAKLVEELRLSIEEKDKTLADSTKEVKVLKAENKKLTADLGYYQPYKSRYEEVLKKTIDKYSGWELIKMGIKKLTNKS